MREKLVCGRCGWWPIQIWHVAIERVCDGFEPILIIPLPTRHQFRDDAFRCVEASGELLGRETAIVDPLFQIDAGRPAQLVSYLNGHVAIMPSLPRLGVTTKRNQKRVRPLDIWFLLWKLWDMTHALTKFREDHGDTLEAFASKLGVTKSHVWKWENGTIPRREQMAKIVEVTGGAVSANDWYVEAAE